MSSIIYSSHLRAGPSEIYNIAADRANIAKLHSASADIESLTVDNLVVTGTVDLPDGSLQILTSGGGQTLVTQPGGGSLFNDTFSLKSLVAGTDITLTPTNTTLTIAASGASAVTLTSAGGQSIVTDGAGPTLQVKGTGNSALLQDVSTGTQIQFDNKCIRVQDIAGNLPPIGDTAVVGAAANVAVGPLSSASGSSGVAVGRSAVAAQTGSVAVGFGASAADSSATAVGRDASAALTGAVAVGQLASASAQDAVAIGRSSAASTTHAVAIGLSSIASSLNTVAMGNSSTASGSSATAVGQNSTASGSESTALGAQTQATAADSTALGSNAQATATGATALGRDATATAVDTTSVGSSADATAVSATALGRVALASGNRSTSLGFSNVASSTGTVAVGSNVTASANFALVFGSSDGANPYVNANPSSVAIGRNIGAVNFTYFACIEDAVIGGWSITRGRMHSNLLIGTPIVADAQTIPADEVFDTTILLTGAGTDNVTVPTGTNLENANSADPLFWANGCGSNFYLKNKTGGPVNVNNNTNSVLLDVSDAPQATLVIDDGHTHWFRVQRTSGNNFQFQLMGKVPH